ncbi:hypothetical protein [Pseudanabaena sp. PCC 6802]|nr:hypothetical protein [Pseudanabaena sp. PCC 6802]
MLANLILTFDRSTPSPANPLAHLLEKFDRDRVQNLRSLANHLWTSCQI